LAQIAADIERFAPRLRLFAVINERECVVAPIRPRDCLFEVFGATIDELVIARLGSSRDGAGLAQAISRRS
jgi:hypothetical protein